MTYKLVIEYTTQGVDGKTHIETAFGEKHFSHIMSYLPEYLHKGWGFCEKTSTITYVLATLVPDVPSVARFVLVNDLFYRGNAHGKH
jgi:hypothetical protein